MAELFKLVKNGEPQPVKEAPFGSEKEFGNTIEKNPGVLGDVQILTREYDTKTMGKIDLLGLDTAENQLVVIELKNPEADASVLLQALRYGAWVRSNIDTVRLQYYKEGAANIDPTPKLAIVAPRIQPLLVELGPYIAVFSLDFVEVRRYKTEEGESFIVVDRLSKVGPLPPPPEPDVNIWKDPTSWPTEEARIACGALEKFAREQGLSSARLPGCLALDAPVRGVTKTELGWPLLQLYPQWNVLQVQTIRKAKTEELEERIRPIREKYHQQLAKLKLPAYDAALKYPSTRLEAGFAEKHLPSLLDATKDLCQQLKAAGLWEAAPEMVTEEGEG